MVGTLQPLADKFPIIGPDGKPTPYFIRWAQQRQVDIGNALSLDTLKEYFAEHQLKAGPGISIAPDGNIDNSPTIRLNANIGDLNDVDTTTTAPTDGQVLTWVDADNKWEPKDPTGGGGTVTYTLPTKVGSDLIVFNASSATINFPAGTGVGDLAILVSHHGWDIFTPAGWATLDSKTGTNVQGAVFYKILSSGDITTGSVTVTYIGSFGGCLGIEVYAATTFTGISLLGSQRTASTTPTVSFTGTVTPADSIVIYGGARANGLVTFVTATVDKSVTDTNASASIGTYDATAVGLFSETISFAASGGGIYACAITVSGITTTSGGGGGGAIANIWMPGPCIVDNPAAIHATATGTYSGDPNEAFRSNARASFFWDNAASHTITFDFGVPVIVTGIGSLQDVTTTNGTWQASGSPDNSTWTSLGSPGVLGNTINSCIVFSNSTAYRYYQLTLVAGNTSSHPYIEQYLFRIGIG